MTFTSQAVFVTTVLHPCTKICTRTDEHTEFLTTPILSRTHAFPSNPIEYFYCTWRGLPSRKKLEKQRVGGDTAFFRARLTIYHNWFSINVLLQSWRNGRFSNQFHFAFTIMNFISPFTIHFVLFLILRYWVLVSAPSQTVCFHLAPLLYPIAPWVVTSVRLPHFCLFTLPVSLFLPIYTIMLSK